jgi:hypothetical protein
VISDRRERVEPEQFRQLEARQRAGGTECHEQKQEKGSGMIGAHDAIPDVDLAETEGAKAQHGRRELMVGRSNVVSPA